MMDEVKGFNSESMSEEEEFQNRVFTFHFKLNLCFLCHFLCVSVKRLFCDILGG